jgi:hypothetical protein
VQLSISACRGMLNPDIKKMIPIAPYEIVYLAINPQKLQIGVYWDSITPPFRPTFGNNHARITAIPIPRICH